MSKPQTWLWLPQSKEAFCKKQDRDDAGFLQMDGIEGMGNPFTGVIRTVSLTSDQDLSGVEITCNGKVNGQIVSEKVAGPKEGIIETRQIFETLTSVRVSGEVKNLSVGTGTTGQTAWFLFDFQRTFPALSAQVVILDGTATYSLMGTLCDPAQPLEMSKRLFPLGNDWKEQTDSKLAPTILFPVRYACVQILKRDEDACLEITLLQQGG